MGYISNLLPQSSTAPNPLVPLPKQPTQTPTSGLGNWLGGVASTVGKDIGGLFKPPAQTQPYQVQSAGNYLNSIQGYGSNKGLVPNVLAANNQSSPQYTPINNPQNGGVSSPNKVLSSTTQTPPVPTITPPTPTPTNASQITTAGQTFVDSNGNTQTAKYDPMTGALLPTAAQQQQATIQQQQPVYTGATQGLLNLRQNGSTQEQNAQNDLLNFQNSYANGIDNIQTTPELLTTQQGQQGALQTKYSNELPAYQGAVTNAIAQEGVQNTALNSAGSLTQPTAGASYFGSPESGGTYGEGSALVNTAVQNAVNQPNLSASDALASLASLGQPAQQAYIAAEEAKDPNWSITNANAIAQYNATQGTNYAGQSLALNTNLSGIQTVEPQITSLISQSELNPSNIPSINALIQNYQTQNNPGAVAALNGAMGEIQNYTSQILGSGGDLTPTQVTAITNSFDPKNFSPTQLTQFLSAIANYGQARLQTLQSSANSSLGSNSSTANQGATANPNPTSPAFTSAQNTGITGVNGGTATQAGAGAALGALNDVEGLISKVSGTAAEIFGAA